MDALSTDTLDVPTPRRLSTATLLRSGPFTFGFITTLGVLLALLLGSAIASLSSALTLIFFAGFVSLGLYPLVRRLESKRISRTGAVLIVLGSFVAIIGLLVSLVVPIISEQAADLMSRLPSNFDNVQEQLWFIDLNRTLGGYPLQLFGWLERAAADPNVWLAVGGGALHVTGSIINATFGVIFVVVLTLYFVASLETIKQSFYELVPMSKRQGFVDIAEEIADSVGKYLGGMFILAVINSAFTFILLTVVGVRYAAILAALALPITLIPLVGSVISTAIITTVSLFTSPGTALVVLISMLVYMQIEAYVLTPRVVGKAISIPGSLVLIGALIGGTLLGLLGALIACPTVASILLIIKKVVVPKQAAS